MMPLLIRNIPQPIPASQELDLQEKSRDASTQILTTASLLILAPNKSRTSASFINNSDVIIFLAKGRAASANTGIRLNAAGGAHEIGLTNLWRGAVYAWALSGANKSLVVEEVETRYAY